MSNAAKVPEHQPVPAKRRRDDRVALLAEINARRETR